MYHANVRTQTAAAGTHICAVCVVSVLSTPLVRASVCPGELRWCIRHATLKEQTQTVNLTVGGEHYNDGVNSPESTATSMAKARATPLGSLQQSM
jgi:hypothetical protein